MKRYSVVTVLFLVMNAHLMLSGIERKPMNNKKAEEFEIPLTEDLMREHGLLNRVLLVYEEITKRITATMDFPMSALEGALWIIKNFIEDYHEKMEEEHIFPLFEKHKKQVRLVRTLKTQHAKGREITAKVQEIVARKSHTVRDKKMIKNLLEKFIGMYRPHEAREDTVVFPQVRSFLSEKEFEALGKKLDDLEHKLFGEHGFESLLHKVASLEKELGIYQLDKFTP